MSTQDPSSPPPPEGPYSFTWGGEPRAPSGSGAAPYRSGYDAADGRAAPGGGSPTGAGATGARNGIGIAALIVGIVSLVLALIPGIGVVGYLGIVAIILGLLGLSRVRRGVATNRGMAITGIVLGALAVVGAIIWTVVLSFFATNLLGGTVQECVSVAPAEQEQCVEDNFGRF